MADFYEDEFGNLIPVDEVDSGRYEILERYGVDEPAEDDSSFLEDIVDFGRNNLASIDASLYSTGRGAGGLISAAEELLGTDTNLGRDIADRYDFLTRKRQEEFADVDPLSAEGIFVHGLAPLAGDLVAAGLTGPAAPLTMMGISGTKGAGNQYLDLRDEGIDPSQAALGAGTRGALDIALERIPAKRFFGGRQGGAIADVLKTGVAEGGTEAAQELGAELGQYIGGGELRSRPELAQDMLVSGVLGSAGGTAARGATLPFMAQDVDQPDITQADVEQFFEGDELTDAPIEEVVDAPQEVPALPQPDWVDPEVIYAEGESDPNIKADVIYNPAPEPQLALPAPEAKAEIETQVAESLEEGDASKVETPQPKKLRSEAGAVRLGPEEFREAVDSVKNVAGAAKRGITQVFNPQDDSNLSDDQAFLEGRQGVFRLPPQITRMSATADAINQAVTGGRRSLLSFRRRLQDRYPELVTPVVKAINKYHDTQHQILFDMSEKLRPFLEVSKDKVSRDKVNKYLEVSRFVARQHNRTIDESPEALAKKGFSQQEIEAIQSVRESTEFGLQNLEQVLKGRTPAQFSPEITRIAEEQSRNASEVYLEKVDGIINRLRQEKYVPFTRTGNWYIYDPDYKGSDVEGAPAGLFAMYDTQAEMQAAFKKLGIDKDSDRVRSGKYVRPAPVEFADVTPDILAELSAVDRTAATALRNMDLDGFQKHLMNARLLAGYEKDFTKSLAQYAGSLSRFVASDGLRRDKAKLGEVLSNHENQALYKRLIQGDGRFFKSDIDSILEGEENSGQALRALGAAYFLSRPMSAAVNATQTYLVTAPVLTSNRFAGSMKGATAAMYNAHKNMGKVLAKKSLGKELDGLLAEAKRRGMIDSSATDALTGLQSGLDIGKRGFVDKSLTLFKAVEKFNRTATFLAAYDVAKKKGMKDPEEILEFSRDLINRTQFDYSDRPPMLRGPLAVPALFKLWSGNYQRTMRDAWREAFGVDGGKANPRPLALMSGLMFLAGGLPAALSGIVPGFKEMEKAGVMVGIDFKTALRDSLNEHGWDSTEQDFIMYGGPMSAFGVSLQGNLALGELAPEMQQGPYAALGSMVAGPIGSAVVDTIARPFYIDEVNPDDSGKYYRMAERIVPPVARDVMEGIRWGTEGAIRDVRERPIRGTEDPSPVEIALTMLGANTGRAAKAYEGLNRLQTFKRGVDSGNANRRAAFGLAEKPEQLEDLFEEIAESLANDDPRDDMRLDKGTIKRMLMREYAPGMTANDALIMGLREDLRPEAMRLDALGR